MKRTTLFLTIFVLALVAVRGVAAAPQHQGSATLTGVVLGPDDKPVPHASVSYQSSGGNAPHAVHTTRRAVLRFPACEQTVMTSGRPERAFPQSGRETSRCGPGKPKP